MNKITNRDKSRNIAEYLSSVMQNGQIVSNEEFEQWIKDNPFASEVLHDLSDKDKLTHNIKNFKAGTKHESARVMLRKISRVKRRRVLIRITSVTAALIAISFVIFNYSGENKIIKNKFAAEEIVSETEDNVRLILDNGEVLELSSVVDTVKTNDLMLKKKGEAAVEFINKNEKRDKISVNRLIVPNKNRYSIVLCDGTRVMLNAGSELIFPSIFDENKREVIMTGEGYFEVAKNSNVPFIVRVNNTEIRVYGTKFNVNSYNSPIVETVLIEGSIGVIFNDREQMIKPNQMYTANEENGSGFVSDIVYVDKYIAWTKGYFVFEADSLSKVAKELSRWYNVEFAFGSESELSVPVTGSFSRDTELDEIVKSLEMISGVKLIKEVRMKR